MFWPQWTVGIPVSIQGSNSAVARVGGLIATALLGAVLAARGPHSLTLNRLATVVGAAAALAAGAAALLWLGDARGVKG